MTNTNGAANLQQVTERAHRMTKQEPEQETKRPLINHDPRHAVRRAHVFFWSVVLLGGIMLAGFSEWAIVAATIPNLINEMTTR